MTKTTRGTQIHPTAIVGEGAEIGVDVEIGPYCIISPHARIGDRTRIQSHAQLINRVEVGADNEIHPGAVIGGTPQDRSYRGEDTTVIIGDRNQIREHVTIHLGSPKGDGITRIGNDCLFMCCTHVAHDCRIDDGVTIGNNTLVAGHVHIETLANVSGGTGLHHWCTVGTLAFVGALARVALDVPPYLIVEGRPGRVRGVNVVGVRRAGIEGKNLDNIREAYKILFHTSDNREAALQKIEAGQLMSDEVQYLVKSLRRSDSGYKGRYLEGVAKGYKALDDDDPHGDLTRQIF